MSFFSELKRRNVFRMGIAYIVVTWVLLQAIDFGLDIISAPNWVMQVFFLAAVVGLPVVLVFAWVFEMTPEGLKRESKIDPDQSITHSTGHKLDRTIITFLAFAVVLLLADRFYSRDDTAAPTPEVVIEEAQGTGEAVDDNMRSVAVLPFVNMSSDPEQEYFSDGLSEELLNRLAQNEQLRIAARTSSFQFKGQNQDIGEIGRLLKVANVLEGSVRKSGNRLRITAQLIRVDSGFHLWSETYEREMDDVFAIQDDIALAITAALEAELGASSAAADSHLTDNMEAYQAYLQARFLLNKRGEANMLKANDLFEQAIALDPAFSKAWSGLAYNLSLLPQYGAVITANEAWERVEAAAEKAIQYEPENAEAFVALGRVNTQAEFSEIQRLYEKAYEIAPNDADVLNLYADFMMQVGDLPAAERLERRAIELDPLAAVHYSDIAYVMSAQHLKQETLEFGRVSASMEPGVPDRADPLIIGLIMNGFYDEAVREIEKFDGGFASHQFLLDWWWCFLYFHQDDEQKLRKKLDGIIDMLGTETAHMDFTLVAFFTAWLDGAGAALPYLSQAHELNEFNLYWSEYFYLPEQVSDDPDWLAFWQQPRLAGLIEMRRANQTLERVGHWKDRQP